MNNYILLVHYKFDPVALLIRLYTKSTWNHCAYLSTKNNCLIESKRSGIVISPISKYNNPWLYKIKLLKIKNHSKNELKNMEMYLFQQVTTKTSYFSHFKTFLGILLGYKPFISKKTCSGLIAYAFAQEGRIFSYKDIDFITPEDIRKACEVKYAA